MQTRIERKVKREREVDKGKEFFVTCGIVNISRSIISLL
jgi:hypothetical protein